MIFKAILTSIFLIAALTAQVTREHQVVLKNWPTPLYWQPTQADIEAGREKTSTLIPRTVLLNVPVPLVFVALTPCRVVDTRASQMFPAPFGAPGLTPGPARNFPIQSTTLCPVPSTAYAYSFNVTVIPPGPLGFLTIYPDGQPQPNAVTLDDLLGTIVNNAAIVPAGVNNGSVDVAVNANTDFVLDINGYYTRPNNTTNTVTGLNALPATTTGINNTADGSSALNSNTTGSFNTASGAFALTANTTGQNNTAAGYNTLVHNTSGGDNTGLGVFALYFNSTGSFNTGTGFNALSSNTTADSDTADGAFALAVNTTGTLNTSSGYAALNSNTTGNQNTATGANALYMNTTGTGNTALGSMAGYNITGSNNIDIGNQGNSADAGVIRIGTNALHAAFFAAGIRGVATGQSPLPVMIDSFGELGTVSSSRRFKEDIQDMHDASSGLLRLRPVTYRYQKPYADGSKPIDYGLIAEEVAEVYPDLVVTGKDGQVETVQYHKLIPMLLNEVQKDHETIQALKAEIRHSRRRARIW